MKNELSSIPNAFISYAILYAYKSIIYKLSLYETCIMNNCTRMTAGSWAIKSVIKLSICTVLPSSSYLISQIKNYHSKERFNQTP